MVPTELMILGHATSSINSPVESTLCYQPPDVRSNILSCWPSSRREFPVGFPPPLRGTFYLIYLPAVRVSPHFFLIQSDVCARPTKRFAVPSTIYHKIEAFGFDLFFTSKARRIGPLNHS